MRRKIELYIGGKLADLDEQSFVLMNFAFSDLQKPTAVKNSYSQQITLPGTPANDAIFGHYYRPDRVSDGAGGTGVDFSALVRTPFVIYDDLGRIYQSGYIKLGGVEHKTSGEHSYKITLYGGLGSFFYNLMYDANEQVRELFDLKYYTWIYDDFGNPDYEEEMDLTTTIGRSDVVSAWQLIDEYHPVLPEYAKHRVLNWAPCYNGIPDEFAADTVLVRQASAGTAGVPASITYQDEHGTTQTAYPYNGYVLAKMEQDFDEWEMCDLRSYLQRPVLNVKAFLDALSRPENNGGYVVEWHTRPNQEEDLWLTLKSLKTIDYAENYTQDFPQDTLQFTGNVGKSFELDVPISTGGKGQSTITFSALPRITGEPKAGENYLFNAYLYVEALSSTYVANALMLQLIAYDGSGNAVACSNVKVLTNPCGDDTAEEIAARAWNFLSRSWNQSVFQPEGGVSYDTVSGFYTREAGTTNWVWNNAIPFSISGQNVVRVVLRGGFISAYDSGRTQEYYNVLKNGGNRYFQWAHSRFLTYSGTIQTVVSAVRNGITLTQKDLLRSSHSVADYLLSLAKMYGWVFTCDEAAKKVDVWSRNAFFTTGLDTIDLTKRIDRSKKIDITPLVVDSKYYSFSLEAIGGCAEQYAEEYGSVYGGQLVNTGFEFNPETNPLTESVIFKQGVPFAERGKNFSRPYVGTTSTWYYGWEQYQRTLTYGGAGALAHSVSRYPVYPTGWMSFSATLPFADPWGKFQFCDADRKPIDGEDVLMYLKPRSLWINGGLDYQVSDDCDEMYYFLGDKPCWICARDGVDPVTMVHDYQVPEFSPFSMVDSGGVVVVGDMLSFGLPQEIYDPFIEFYSEQASLYWKYWRAYLADRLDKDTKIMKAKVDLSGLDVSPQLLRRFFWYAGRIWTLNKITNHSLTTFDPTDCEFIEVKDIENFTNGQNL